MSYPLFIFFLMGTFAGDWALKPSTPEPCTLSDAELVTRLDEVFAAEQMLAAQLLALIAQIDARGLAARDGATSTAAWLRERLRLHPVAARQMVRLAQALESAFPATADALAEAGINEDQAHAIVQAVRDLPDEIGHDLRIQAEQALLGFAGELGPMQLRLLGARVLAHVAPEVAERLEREQLERAEARAWRDRAFTLSPHGPGRVRLSGWLDSESAATVSAAIEPLCSPAAARAQAPEEAPEAVGQAPTSAVRDERTAGQRRADALVQVCRMAAGGDGVAAHGGQRPQVMVMMPFEPWREATAEAVGELDNGQRITPQTLRRMACDSDVIPVVLGGAGQPLDVGRQHRLVTAAIRKALNVRDRGCCFPACDRPLSWCDAHHIVPWLDGGVTSLWNMLLLCRLHHRMLHEGHWQVRLGPDQLPEFIPPSYIDPQRRPRRNQYHRLT